MCRFSSISSSGPNNNLLWDYISLVNLLQKHIILQRFLSTNSLWIHIYCCCSNKKDAICIRKEYQYWMKIWLSRTLRYRQYDQKFWVLFVLQFLASETAMIGRQYQISPECNSNLRSLNKNEIFTFHFLSDRDMGNCNVGWSIRSHPSLYELSRSFFQSIGIGIVKFWSWCESENISDIIQS